MVAEPGVSPEYVGNDGLCGSRLGDDLLLRIEHGPCDHCSGQCQSEEEPRAPCDSTCHGAWDIHGTSKVARRRPPGCRDLSHQGGLTQAARP